MGASPVEGKVGEGDRWLKWKGSVKSFGLGELVNRRRILYLHTLVGIEDSGLTFWVDNSSELMNIPKLDEKVDNGRL